MSIPPVPDDQQQPQQPRYAPPPQYPTPQYPTPQYPAPQYGQPQYGTPVAPAYGQPQYGAPVAPAYGTAWGPGPGEPYDGAASPDDLTRPLYGATFGQAIRRFFKNYANFKGRASRSEFWWVYLFVTLASLVPAASYVVGMTMLAGSESISAYNDNGSMSAPAQTAVVLLMASLIIIVVGGFALLIPSLALVWRRLHDVNFAGPMYFISFIPYGSIAVLVFAMLSSNPQGRRFDQR